MPRDIPSEWRAWALAYRDVGEGDPALGRDYHAMREACNAPRLAAIITELMDCLLDVRVQSTQASQQPIEDALSATPTPRSKKKRAVPIVGTTESVVGMLP